MSWQERLQQGIALVSPLGEEFIADWRGDKRSVDKVLGVFKYPFVRGVRVQDLDVAGVTFPLTIYFEGVDNDLVSERFFAACGQRGLWTVNHPTKGIRILQLVSVTENIQPVESGNLTVFDTEWLEPMVERSSQSVAQLGAAAKATAAVVMEKAGDQFEDGTKLDKPGLLARFKAGVAGTTKLIADTLAPITQTVAEVNAQVESIHRGIVATLDSSALSVVALAGQVQNLIDLPGQIKTDLGVRLEYYGKLITDVTGLTDKNSNDAATKELVVVTALSSVMLMVTDSSPTTREESLELVDTVAATLATVTSALDTNQTQFAGNTVETRYFSQSAAYTDTARLVAQVMELLLRQAFDLAVAKRFTLKTNRCPVEIALTEGVDLDLFISSNGLKGNDILLLPAGREVVVYVTNGVNATNGGGQ
jgi:prophage DNA circulation protein